MGPLMLDARSATPSFRTPDLGRAGAGPIYTHFLRVRLFLDGRIS